MLQAINELKEHVDEMSANVSKSLVPKKDHKTASKLSSTQFQEFNCGPLRFDIEFYSSGLRDDLFDSIYMLLDQFYNDVQSKLSREEWEEVDNCQPLTDELLKSICPLYFMNDEACCVREFKLRFDNDNFSFSCSGSLDHAIVTGSMNDSENVKFAGHPLVYVESKHLKWDFKQDHIAPKAQAFVYLTALAELISRRSGGQYPPLLYILLHGGEQWLLLCQKCCETPGDLYGKYLYSATNPLKMSDEEDRKKVACWIMLCFRQGKALYEDNFSIEKKFSGLTLLKSSGHDLKRGEGGSNRHGENNGERRNKHKRGKGGGGKKSQGSGGWCAIRQKRRS